MKTIARHGFRAVAAAAVFAVGVLAAGCGSHRAPATARSAWATATVVSTYETQPVTLAAVVSGRTITTVTGP